MLSVNSLEILLTKNDPIAASQWRKNHLLKTTIIALLCANLISSCTTDQTREPDSRHLELRNKLHAQMAGNTYASSRQSWDIIADAAKQPNNTIRLFYKRNTIAKTHSASGENQHKSNYWNREHVWPQSYGLERTPAAKDLHNLVPADRTVNSSRGNKFFDKATDSHKECSQCKTSKVSWEPPNSVKGDIARILFYMDVRYDGSDGTPDLQLSDSPDEHNAKFGMLSTLYGWHCSDPVSTEEKRRNNVVAKAQGNRNVFVDNPQLAESLFEFPCSNATIALSVD